MTELATGHFTLEEFEASQVATRNGWGNSVPPELMANALATLQMLQLVRDHLCQVAGRDVPVLLSSGYRSPRLNLAVGGSQISDHIRAQAADWTAPAFGTPLQVCRALEPHVGQLGIGQLIHEFGRWVHTSTRAPMVARNRIITISRAGTRVGIQEA